MQFYDALSDVNVESLSVEALHYTRKNSCDSLTLSPVERILPDTLLLDVEMCHAILTDRDDWCPHPDPWSMNEGELLQFSEEMSVDLPPWDSSEDELRLIVARAISDGSVSGLDAWQMAVADSDFRFQTHFMPTSSGYYDIPQACKISPELIQARLRDLSVCAVMKEGEVKMMSRSVDADFYLAVCEAYVRLGLLPPFELLTTGRGSIRKVHPVVIRACLRTVSLQPQHCAKITEWLTSLDKLSSE